MAQKKVKPTKGYRVGYGRPPGQNFATKKARAEIRAEKKREPPSTAADLRALLERALNAKVQSGAGAKLVTTAAAGIEQLVAQYAAGDRHARRDVFALAKEAGKERANAHARAYKANKIVIEDAGAGTFLIQELKKLGLPSRCGQAGAR